MTVRLQKLLAQAGFGSRRNCETLIASGRVFVNGERAHLGQKADPNRDRIEIDGKRIELTSPIYIKLNKPKGVISSTTDELNQGRKTIMDLVQISEHLFPVGRLDKQSEGLMLLTNDGTLTHRLTHPRYQHEKVYEVILDGNVPAEALQQWRRGIFLEGRKTAPASIEVLEQLPDSTKLQVRLREGRKRQIRKIAAQLGFPVKRLNRLQIGPLKLGDLNPGEWRHLTDQEVEA
ncbi:MAG: pseudouridine synthase, partial [Chloroflexota bacterium]